MQAFFLFLWNHKPAGLPVFTSCCWVWKDKNEILLDQKKKSKAEPAAELLSSSKSIFWYLNYVCLPESSEKFEITLSILNERLVMLFFSLHWVRSVCFRVFLVHIFQHSDWIRTRNWIRTLLTQRLELLLIRFLGVLAWR